MAIQLQIRRGSTAENDAFTGAAGELSVDLSNKSIRVHDGSTAGGTELARSNQIDSVLSKDVAGAVDVTLSAGEAESTNHEYTGILTGNINVIVPNTVHNFTAENLTTGAYSLTVKTAAGTGIVIPQGKTLPLYNSGTNVEDSASGKKDIDSLSASIASAATLDLTAATGNIVPVSGTTAVSAITMPVGKMTIIPAAALPFTNTATTCEVIGEADYVCVAGDPVEIINDGTTVTVIPNVKAFSGVYTPTLYNTTNITSSTAYELMYTRIGNVVTVSGAVAIVPASAAQTVLGLSLPIPSNFTAFSDAGGAFNAGLNIDGGSILADDTNDRALLYFISTTTTNYSYQFSFSYKVK